MSTINPGMSAGFDEQEWRESAKDGPSFRFGPGKGADAGGGSASYEPEEPRPFDAEGDDDAGHRSEWQEAEPAWSGARRPRESHFDRARRPDLPSAEDRSFAMIAHGMGAVGELVSAGLVGWLVPLVLWLIKKDEGGFAADQAREALNFQITMWIWWGVGALLCLTIIGLPVGIPLCILSWIFNIVFSIVGAFRTYKGESYQYPVNMRLIAA